MDWRTHIFRPPPPQIALDNCTANDWPQNRPSHDGQCISDNGSTALFRRPDVAQHAARIRDGRGPENTSEEPRQHHRLNILGSCSAEGEYSGYEIRHEHSRFPSIHLGKRRPDERANAEAEQKQRETECTNLPSDPEIGRYLCNSWRVAFDHVSLLDSSVISQTSQEREQHTQNSTMWRLEPTHTVSNGAHRRIVAHTEGTINVPIVVNPYSTVVMAFFLNPQFKGL